MSMYRTLSQVNDYLFISGAQAITSESLAAHRITVVINATLEVPNLYYKQAEYINIKIDDSPFANLQIHFDSVADKIEEVRRKGGRTLVHCIAGASRSASLCLAYLMKYKKMKLREAFHYLKSRRSVIHPNSGFFKQLIDYEKKLFGESSVKMVGISTAGTDLLVPDIYVDQYKGFVWLSSLKHAMKRN